jgi:hypothetical protein
MATVNKDFKIKSGLIVEGTTATVNGYDVLTKKQDDQDYIVGLIGGTSTSQNTPDTVVKRDGNGNFAAGEITADLVGDVTGQVSDISNHSTTDLSEGTNKYFTNQRALDATASAYDAAGSASAAQTAAEDYADTVANNAYNNAVTAAANDATSKMQQAESYADQSALDAQNAAENYADGLISTEVTNRNNAISDAISTEVTDRNNAIDSAITNLNLSGTYDALGAASTALNDAKAYTDQEVSALVDSAPALLDTLNELAAAIADNPNYATDVANLVATKADTTYVNQEISNVDGAAQQYASSAETAAKNYADGLANNYDAAGSATNAYNNAVDYVDGQITQLDGIASGYASTAEQNAKNYADGLAVNYDAAGSAFTAEQNANTYTNNQINNLTTDDIEEGVTNQYFLDSRAKASAADLLTGATLSNITITGSGAGLTITAENGVAQSTTDDLTEGNNNLYFTNQRVYDAIDGQTITPQAVQINNYRKEEATQQYVSTTSTVNVHSFGYPYESVKYLVRVVGWVDGVKHSQITEILMTVDGNNNVAMTEYGNVHTSTNPLATFSAVVNNGVPSLTATTSVNGCEIIAAATMLSWAD